MRKKGRRAVRSSCWGRYPEDQESWTIEKAIRQSDPNTGIRIVRITAGEESCGTEDRWQ